MSYTPHSIPSGTSFCYLTSTNSPTSYGASFFSHAAKENHIPENKVWKIALAVVPIVGAFAEAGNRSLLREKLGRRDLYSKHIERIETSKKYCLAGIARNVLWIAAAVSAATLGVLSHPVAIGILVGLPAFGIAGRLWEVYKLSNI
jgi:hypothetical protein